MKFIHTPTLVMDLATRELSRMTNVAKDIVSDAKRAIVYADRKSVERISEYEIVRIFLSLLLKTQTRE